MRVIGFFHLSPQGGDSLSKMEQEFQEFCSLNMHQPVNIFAATGEAGPRDDPAYRRMMDYLRQSGSEFLVAVPDARHLGDDLESVARAIVELEETGAAVKCFDEDLPDPIQNAFQTLGVKGVSRTRSRRIKESMQARALKGQALGKPPFGYHIGPEGSLEVVPSEATVVELIFRLYTRDEIGFRLIAQHLNERGIPTRRGSNWSVVGIRDILRNPVYTGTYTRLGMRQPRTHDAIIPHEVFRAARELTQSRRPLGRISNFEPFLLSGLIECGYCGNKMMGVTRRQSWKRKDGHRQRGVYRYYQCQSRNNQSVCGYHTWRASLLEGTVLGQLGPALRARAAGAGGNEAERIQCENLLREQIPLNRTIGSSFTERVQAVASGEIIIAVADNGMVAELAAHAEGTSFEFTWATPKEGAITWHCGLSIHPAAIKHGFYEQSHEIIDSFISPEAGAYEIGNWYYGHSNVKSYAGFTEEFLQSIGQTGHVEEFLATAQFQQIMNEPEVLAASWEELKAGY